MSVLDTLRGATAARKSVTMCVDGALQAEWDSLKDQLDDAAREDTQNGSLALPKTTAIVNQMDELREKVAASEVTFLFEKMDWSERLALQAAHPPRDNNLPDRIRGFNNATFYPALIKASCVSVAGADGDVATDVPDEVWDALLGTPATDDKPAVPGSLNLGQVNTLSAAANHVNDGETTVPPSARFLLGNQDSEASLAQPSPGTPPPSGSEDGNPSGSPTTSTTKKARKPAGSSGR